MHVLQVRNVHEAFPRGIKKLVEEGNYRESRNGPVVVHPQPITTVYERPYERVLFWPHRDANPFFHLYESLWMLAGRDDVDGPSRYAKNMLRYSDDGETLHGAYGHRWRKFPVDAPASDIDQLPIIVRQLMDDPNDRRSVLQIWDVTQDLGRSGNDVPCNTIASFQRDDQGHLDLTVFCRSNDIIWGAYGANAVHFSMLQEYMANWIGCPIGYLYQVSVNWHAYLDVLEKFMPWYSSVISKVNFIENPYIDRTVKHVPLVGCTDEIDSHIEDLLRCADTSDWIRQVNDDLEWSNIAYRMLKAHHLWRVLSDETRFIFALEELEHADSKADWIVAGKQWIERRYAKWQQDHL